MDTYNNSIFDGTFLSLWFRKLYSLDVYYFVLTLQYRNYGKLDSQKRLQFVAHFHLWTLVFTVVKGNADIDIILFFNTS